MPRPRLDSPVDMPAVQFPVDVKFAPNARFFDRLHFSRIPWLSLANFSSSSTNPWHTDTHHTTTQITAVNLSTPNCTHRYWHVSPANHVRVCVRGSALSGSACNVKVSQNLQQIHRQASHTISNVSNVKKKSIQFLSYFVAPKGRNYDLGCPSSRTMNFHCIMTTKRALTKNDTSTNDATRSVNGASK